MTSLLFLRLPPRVPSVSIPRSELDLNPRSTVIAFFCALVLHYFCLPYLAILRKVGMRSWGTRTVLIEELLLNWGFAERSKVGTGFTDEGAGEEIGGGLTQRS